MDTTVLCTKFTNTIRFQHPGAYCIQLMHTTCILQVHTHRPQSHRCNQILYDRKDKQRLPQSSIAHLLKLVSHISNKRNFGRSKSVVCEEITMDTPSPVFLTNEDDCFDDARKRIIPLRNEERTNSRLVRNRSRRVGYELVSCHSAT